MPDGFLFIEGGKYTGISCDCGWVSCIYAIWEAAGGIGVVILSKVGYNLGRKQKYERRRRCYGRQPEEGGKYEKSIAYRKL